MGFLICDDFFISFAKKEKSSFVTAKYAFEFRHSNKLEKSLLGKFLMTTMKLVRNSIRSKFSSTFQDKNFSFQKSAAERIVIQQRRIFLPQLLLLQALNWAKILNLFQKFSSVKNFKVIRNYSINSYF